MAVYLLDTTTLTHLQRDHPHVTANFSAHAGDTVGVTSVNVEEVVGGWINLVRKAATNAREAVASQSLADAVAFLTGFPVFAATEVALDRFDRLVRLKLNVGRMDLKIAAIALELGATVVTNNARDFGRVPNLLREDWTI
jgi:tRNA(fMet)-specific endonuclease VapC